jgi:hypothetical protein
MRRRPAARYAAESASAASATGTARIRTPGIRGSTASRRMFSKRRISPSALSASIPGTAVATPPFSAMPMTRSPPVAFASKLTSARNSRLAASLVPTVCLYSSARPSGTAFSTRASRCPFASCSRGLAAIVTLPFEQELAGVATMFVSAAGRASGGRRMPEPMGPAVVWAMSGPRLDVSAMIRGWRSGPFAGTSRDGSDGTRTRDLRRDRPVMALAR